MKYLLFIVLLLLSFNSNAQKFNKVVTTSIDSVNSYTVEYKTNIEFRLNEGDKSLLIFEAGSEPVLIRFDLVHYKKNGVYLITIGKPDYFIISKNCVVHHREYCTPMGSIIIRNKYQNKNKTKI